MARKGDPPVPTSRPTPNNPKRSQPEKRPRAPLPSAWERAFTGREHEGGLGARAPTFSLFPGSERRLERKWGSGEIFPAPRSGSCLSLPNFRSVPGPGTLQSLWRVPGPGAGLTEAPAPTRADSSHSMNGGCLDRRGGRLCPARPQHVRPGSRPLPDRPPG